MLIAIIVLSLVIFGLVMAFFDFKHQIGWLHRRIKKLEEKSGITEKEASDLL